MSVEDVLKEKKIVLPEVVVPVANYMLASRSGKIVMYFSQVLSRRSIFWFYTKSQWYMDVYRKIKR